MDDIPSFGAWLRRRRKALDLTQDALAQLVGCAMASIRKYESDEQRPSRAMAERLAAQLQLPPEERPTFVRYARGRLDALPPALPTPASAPIPSGPPVVSSARDLASDFPATASRSRGNLPAQLTPFLGRAQELAALEALLAQADTRVVTIIGHGGMGKTRLALALGERLRPHRQFPDGIFLAALAPLSAAAHLEPALADALGFPLSATGLPRPQLCDYLQAKRVLLLLDNCEHVREGVCDLVAALLAAAPGVQILATARTARHARRAALPARWATDGGR